VTRFAAALAALPALAFLSRVAARLPVVLVRSAITGPFEPVPCLGGGVPGEAVADAPGAGRPPGPVAAAG